MALSAVQLLPRVAIAMSGLIQGKQTPCLSLWGVPACAPIIARLLTVHTPILTLSLQKLAASAGFGKAGCDQSVLHDSLLVCNLVSRERST